MARGDMRYATTEIRPSGAEILNREVFEGVPMTIDFTDVSTTDSDTGEKVVKAGSVISGTGTVVAATPWTGGAGILLLMCMSIDHKERFSKRHTLTSQEQNRMQESLMMQT